MEQCLWDTEHESSAPGGGVVLGTVVRHFPVWERERGTSSKGNSFLSLTFFRNSDKALWVSTVPLFHR